MNVTSSMRAVAPRLAAALAVALLALPGCEKASQDNRCLGEPGIVPGLGIRTARGSACLGARARSVEADFGAPDRVEDLGALGTRRHYGADHLVLRFDGTGRDARLTAVEILPGVVETTPEGLGPGSEATAVRAAWGEPGADPFLGAWWYPERGATLLLTDDRVARLQIASPTP